MNTNESHIIAQVLAGKTEAFAYFLDTYGQQIFTLIVQMVSSPEDAEELTQDTFMKAFRHLGSFTGGSSFSTWIYTALPTIPRFRHCVRGVKKCWR